jgi:hypothetical protein
LYTLLFHKAPPFFFSRFFLLAHCTLTNVTRTRVNGLAFRLLHCTSSPSWMFACCGSQPCRLQAGHQVKAKLAGFYFISG